jgi:hypothetical protein
MTLNLYEQQIADFLVRARIRLGQLTNEVLCHQLCDCKKILIGDLYAAIRTLSYPWSMLSVEDRLKLVEVMTAQAELEQVFIPEHIQGVIVREGGEAETDVLVLSNQVTYLQNLLFSYMSGKDDFNVIYAGNPDFYIK